MARVQNSMTGAASAATLRWHLTLLGISGIALSVASGWTTWDGMSNFTQNPVLSFLITFGIQSVMLVAAWMIGETFAEQANASGSGGRSGGGRTRSAGPPSAAWHQSERSGSKMVLVWLAIFALSLALMSNAVSGRFPGLSLGYGPAIAALVAAAMLLRAVLRLFGLDEIVRPYERSTTAILKNIPLWTMFLVCLTASVFFSFDSLFDRIYSETDRKAVSRSRLQNHVSGLLPDLHDVLEKSRRAAAGALFDDPAWQAFDSSVDALTRTVDDVRAGLENRRRDEAKDRQLQFGKEVALLSSAGTEMDSVGDQLERAEADLEQIDKSLAKTRAEEQKIDLALTAQRVQMEQAAQEAVLEAAGQGLSQLTGKGPKYRELKTQEAGLRIAVNRLTSQLAATQRLTARLMEQRVQVIGRIEQLRSAQSEIAGRIAQAEWRIDDFKNNSPGGVATLEGFAPEVVALNAARAAFQDQPNRQTYAALNSQCGNVAAIPPSVSRGNPAIRSFECGTLAGNGALVGIFDANAALARFQQACGKTRKLTGLSADELFRIGQSCIRLSGLNSAVAAEFLSDLRQVSLRRDDRAHRFVVTWNAFFDTNPLAFVALFIALAIDGLVFVSGLFGANAQITLRMLARDKPSRTEQVPANAHDAVLDFALLPNAAGTARLLLDSLTQTPGVRPDCVAGELDTSAMSGEDAARIRPVLNAACALNMAEKVDDGPRFTVTTELISALSARTDWQAGVSAGTWVKSNPEEMLAVALGQDQRQITQCVLEQSQPVPAETGYAYALDICTCPEHIQSQMTAVLNAGVAGGTVSGDPDRDQRYLLTAAFVSMIARLTAGKPDPARSVDATPAENVAAAPDRAAEATSSEPEPAMGGISASEDRPDQQAGPPEPAEGADRPISSTRTAPPVVIPRDETVHDKASSSKLIAFPAEPGLRRPSQAGFDRRSDKSDPDRAIATSQDLGSYENDEILEEAITGLIAGSDIARQDIVAWLHARPGHGFDAAWSVLQEMRDRDHDFQARLRKHERLASDKIELFLAALPADFWNSDGLKTGGAPGGRTENPNRIYRPFLLRAYALKEAMAWCVRAISELEVNSVVNTDSEAQRSQQVLIEKIIAAMSPLDRNQAEDWGELELRVSGLGRQHSELESFTDLMP